MTLISNQVALANPLGPQVVHGQASFGAPNPNTLNISNTPGAIINWQSFSIQQNELTRFIQQGVNSAVLNRIVGQDPSGILGKLQSNGRVFLINPNGIVFGPDAVIDTAGFIASTLNMTDKDFLAGRYHFDAGPNAGDIRNRGLIRSGAGGDVILVAPNIENSGIIRADDGKVLLAAGRKITLSSTGLDGIQFEVQAPENQVLNLGQLIAEHGAVGVFAGSIRHSGIIEAGGVGVDDQGNVVLMAKADIGLSAGSRVSANGSKGGSIAVESETGTALVAGTVEATGTDSTGGAVRVLGEQVGLVGDAVIDVSGHSGGGEALIGGDYKGQSSVKNAAATFVGGDTLIRADAVNQGDGGKVIVWADGATRAYGNISARGGAQSGDGGFVETSGRAYLDVGRSPPDLSAPNGMGGTWLLDPHNVTVQAGPGNLDLQSPNFSPAVDDSTIDAAVINAALDADIGVAIDTGATGTQPGDIAVNAALTKSAGSGTPTLSLNAANNLTINSPVSDTSAGSLGMNITVGGVADVNANVDTGGGFINFIQGDVNLNGVNLSTAAATVASGGATTASATVDGGTWANTGFLSVGASGTGTVNVTNGGSVSANDVQLGQGPGSNGLVTIDGAGSTWTDTGFTIVGFQGNGTLDVSNGATLNTNGMNIADQPGSTGAVTVDGSNWNDATGLFVGWGGIGTLNAINGAGLNMNGFGTAGQPGSSGTATIDGSTLIANGFANIGFQGTGSLNVINGATLNTNGANIGDQAGSTGTVTIDGSTWNDASGLFVGWGGTGTLNAVNGASLNMNDFNTAGQPGSSGTATIDGSTLIANGFANVGFQGTGSLNVINGATLNMNDFFSAAGQPGSSGTVTIDGSTLIANGFANIGAGGTAALNVINGATLTTAGASIGSAVTGIGTATVTGAASQWNNTTSFVVNVGGEGQGTLTIEKGGRFVDSVGSMTIANGGSSSGSLIVRDPGSELDLNGGFLGIAYGSVFTLADDGVDYGTPGMTTGTVNVLQGGVVRGGTIRVGNGFKINGGSTDGALTISGVGSLVDVGQIFVGDQQGVGARGKGTLNISGGARVQLFDLEVGRSGEDNVATITDPGTTVIISNDNGHFLPPFDNEAGFLRVARDFGDRGTLNVLNGAYIEIREGSTTTESGPGVQIARNAGTFGRLLVDNAIIDISQRPTSPVTAFDGGPFLTLNRGDAGVVIRNGGEIRLTGEQSFVHVGRGGDGTEFSGSDDPNQPAVFPQNTIELLSGGKLTVNGLEAGVSIARFANADGLVRVSGTGSTLSISGFNSGLNVGREGRGELIIENGGVVDPTFMSVGRETGSSGSLTITGAGSKLVLSGAGTDQLGNPQGPFMHVGRSGTGTVDVLSGGQIEIIGGSNPLPGFNIGRDPSGVGTLTVDGAGSQVTVSSDLTNPNGAIMQVGREGTGTMIIRNGGTVLNDPDGNAIVGRESTAVGQVTVDGAGSVWDAGNLLAIGRDFDVTSGQPTGPGGTGSVVATNGGSFVANTIITQPSEVADVVTVVQEISAVSTDQVLALQTQQDSQAGEPPAEEKKQEKKAEEVRAGRTAERQPPELPTCN